MANEMTHHRKQLWIEIGLITVAIIAFIFQGYTIYQLQKEISKVNLNIINHETTLTTIEDKLNKLEKESNKKFFSVNALLEKSSTQITSLQEDISDVQLDLTNVQIQSHDFSSIIDEVLPAVVSVVTNRAQGSGVIIKKDGYIVTNQHVIENAEKIRIVTTDKEVYPAEVIGLSKEADIAVLKIDENNLEFLKFADSDEVKIGERVIAVGSPAGLSFSVTEGIVSATQRIGPNGIRAYIQTDVPINPGNSGGPLVNIKKEIIGINNFKIGGFESLGFAIDSNHVKEIVNKIFEELKKLETQVS